MTVPRRVQVLVKPTHLLLEILQLSASAPEVYRLRFECEDAIYLVASSVTDLSLSDLVSCG